MLQTDSKLHRNSGCATRWALWTVWSNLMNLEFVLNNWWSVFICISSVESANNPPWIEWAIKCGKKGDFWTFFFILIKCWWDLQYPRRMACSTLIFITREKVQTKTTSGAQNGGSRLRKCRSTGKSIPQGLETSWAAWRKEPPSKNVAGSAGQRWIWSHVVISSAPESKLGAMQRPKDLCVF